MLDKPLCVTLTDVYLQGSHYHDYAQSLQSLLVAGCHDRLILLHGDGELDSEVEQLRIPSLVVPNLFISVNTIKSTITLPRGRSPDHKNRNTSFNTTHNLSHHLKSDSPESSTSDEDSVSSFTLTEDDGAPPSPKVSADVERASLDAGRDYISALQSDSVKQIILPKFSGGARNKAKWMQVRLKPRRINHNVVSSSFN